MEVLAMIMIDILIWLNLMLSKLSDVLKPLINPNAVFAFGLNMGIFLVIFCAERTDYTVMFKKKSLKSKKTHGDFFLFSEFWANKLSSILLFWVFFVLFETKMSIMDYKVLFWIFTASFVTLILAVLFFLKGRTFVKFGKSKVSLSGVLYLMYLSMIIAGTVIPIINGNVLWVLSVLVVTSFIGLMIADILSKRLYFKKIFV